MTGPGIALRSIMPAFEGVIPATIATASADGTPNITYISVARFLDEERIAISNQFFGKTTSNLGANPFLAIRVVDPETMLEYELDATRLRSERAGELFDSMRAQIDAIADQTGMRGVFRLRSVEILRVDRCGQVEGSVGNQRRRTSGAAVALDGLSVFIGRLDDCRELGELTQTALELLDDLFGIGSSMLLMADHNLKSLFVVAHHGYACGVGAEIAVDEGVIGVAAQRRRQVLVSHVTRARTLNRVAGRTEDRHEIRLPGLDDAQSLVATPVMLRGRLVGVLYVDSAEPGRFSTADGQLLDVIARQIGMSIGLLDTTTDDLSPDPRRAGAKPAADSGACSVTFHDPDGSVLVDGDYVIRGVAGRILYAMLTEYQRSGRVRFSNRELRLNRDIGLPAGNDNLDARLVALRRRLAERGDPFQLQHTGRGQLELIVTSGVHIVRLERNDVKDLP